MILYLFLCGRLFSQQAGANFHVTACPGASPEDGDNLYRSVFFIECPVSMKGPAFLRIFDADVGGSLDRLDGPSGTRFLLFGKGRILPDVRSIRDSVSAKDALLNLELGRDERYDKQWRTLVSFQAGEGEQGDSTVLFQFIVEGVRGACTNLYRIFVSSDDKVNNAVEGVRITSPVVTVMTPASADLVSQLRFRIPRKALHIQAFNFDAEDMGELFIQTPFREKIPVAVSGNGLETSTRVAVDAREQGQEAALIIAGNRFKADYIQCWITGDSGIPLGITVPAEISRMNHLPVPAFTALPLSDCRSLMLDASATRDPDGDKMTFEWFLEKKKIGEGRRIVNAFPSSGLFPVELLVKDHSGFLAHSKSILQTVTVNSLPVAGMICPAVAAPGEMLSFDASPSRDSDGGILRFRWDFGDGRKAEGMEARHAYIQAGRYTVTLVVEDDGPPSCNYGEASSAIWINSPPIAEIEIREKAAVGEEITLDGTGSIDSDGEILRYLWDTGDGGKEEGASATHRYASPGVYQVRLTVQDNAGAGNSIRGDTAAIVVNARPIAVVKAAAVVSPGEQVLFDGSGSSDTDGRVLAYEWEFGDGASKTGEKVRHTYEKPGRYPVRLTVEDNSGTANSRASADFSIRVNSPPVPDAGGDRLVNSSEVAFDARNSRDEDDPIIDYQWDFGDRKTARGPEARHVYALPGTYKPTLTVRDASGTSSSERSVSFQVHVNHPPVADAGSGRVAAPGEKIVLDAAFSHDPDGEITSYEWEPEVGHVLNGRSVEYAFSRPGVYQAMLKIRDSASAEDWHSVQITVNDKPVAVIAPIPRTAPGRRVFFDGSSSRDSDGAITEAHWDFGDGSPPVQGLSASHVYAKPGRYLAVLTVRDDSQASNNTATSTSMVSVNHAPIANAGPDIYTCSPTVRFNAMRSQDADRDPLLYYWNFGDSTTGSGQQLTHVYRRPGVYPVRLTVDDCSGLENAAAEIYIKIHINSSPRPVILAADAVCAGENTLFDAGRSSDPDNDLLTYAWDFGDGEKGEGVNPVHVFRKGGIFQVRLTVSDNSGLACRSAVKEHIIEVVDAPVAEAGEDLTVCSNTTVTLDGSGSSGGSRSIQGYEWDFGDGQQGGGVKTVHSYAQPGLYTVRLKISVPPAGGCENYSEDALLVKVLPSPVAAFRSGPAGCPGQVLPFDAGASSAGNEAIVRYEWDFGDGAAGEGMTTTHAFEKPGRYRIRLTVKTDAGEACNTSMMEQDVIINAKPHAAFSVHAVTEEAGVILPLSVVNFDARGSADSDGIIKSYSWDFGDGGRAEGIFVQHRYRQPGKKTVRLIVEDNSGTGCANDMAEVQVDIAALPVERSIQAPEKAYIRQPVLFAFQGDVPAGSAGGGGYWIFSDGDTAFGEKVQKAFAVPGTYQVLAFWDGVKCAAREIRILDLPSVILPEILEVECGEPLVLHPGLRDEEKAPLTYHWDMGDGTVLDRMRIEHVYREPGDYSAALKLGHAGLESFPEIKYVVRVHVRPKPEFSIRCRPDTLYSGGARDEATFYAVISDSTRNFACTWDFGDGETATGVCVQHVFQRPGSFLVQLTVRDSSRKSAPQHTTRKSLQVLPR
jgi:PKD repeat protein